MVSVLDGSVKVPKLKIDPLQEGFVSFSGCEELLVRRVFASVPISHVHGHLFCP